MIRFLNLDDFYFTHLTIPVLYFVAVHSVEFIYWIAVDIKVVFVLQNFEYLLS